MGTFYNNVKFHFAIEVGALEERCWCFSLKCRALQSQRLTIHPPFKIFTKKIQGPQNRFLASPHYESAIQFLLLASNRHVGV